jgi:hypothetical protein
VARSGEPDFDAIGATLLRGKQRAVEIPLRTAKGANGRRLICFATHEACLQVLQDDEVFSLRPYDAAFQQLLKTEDLKAILGENSSARTFRLHMLRQASVRLAGKLAPTATAQGNRPQDSLVGWIEDVTRENCRIVLEALRHNPARRDQFNLVREYIWPVAYMSVRDIVGYRMPDSLSSGVRAILLARNLDAIRTGSGSWFCPVGDLAAAANMHFSMLTMAGHIVAAGSGGNVVLRMLARHSLAHFLATYGPAESYAARCQPPSLAQTLHDPAFKKELLAAGDASITPEQYDVFARNTILELAIAMGGLMPLAFTKAFQFAFGPMIVQAGADRDTFVKAMGDPGKRDAAFSESLRLNPPVARVFRTATQNTRIAHFAIAAGDQVALLFSSAAQDAAAFPDAAAFKLDRGAQYLDFGHSLSPHNCFGENIAKTIFAVLFAELDAAADPAFSPDTDGLQMYAGQLPDDMPWTFNPPQ